MKPSEFVKELLDNVFGRRTNPSPVPVRVKVNNGPFNR